jgi:hypothetical protein
MICLNDENTEPKILVSTPNVTKIIVNPMLNRIVFVVITRVYDVLRAGVVCTSDARNAGIRGNVHGARNINTPPTNAIPISPTVSSGILTL